MAYTIHQTEGYVLKSSMHGEANKRIDLLTKELGLIRGTAQGVRYLKSKLRYSLTDFSRVEVSLVRGKDIWRIVNASKYDDIFFDMREEYRIVFLKVFSLISRLITGEFREPHIFSLIRGAHLFVSLDTHKINPLTTDELFGLEALLIIQLLHYLGYVGEGTLLQKYQEENWSRDMLRKVAIERRAIATLINETLSHTGL